MVAQPNHQPDPWRQASLRRLLRDLRGASFPGGRPLIDAIERFLRRGGVGDDDRLLDDHLEYVQNDRTGQADRPRGGL